MINRNGSFPLDRRVLQPAAEGELFYLVVMDVMGTFLYKI